MRKERLIGNDLFPTGESVTGGKTAVAHSRPYMASVQLNGKHECGAFLIASQWLLSATHCFVDG